MARKIDRLRIKSRDAISGKNNVFINKGVLINVKYDIVGDGNTIEIMKGAILSNMMIYMRGDNHKLKIGEDCRYKGCSVWFEYKNLWIEIGKNHN